MKSLKAILTGKYHSNDMMGEKSNSVTDASKCHVARQHRFRSRKAFVCWPELGTLLDTILALALALRMGRF